MKDGLFTSESVSEGHPDKVCDLIADSILDAYLERDSRAHVACEVLCKGPHVIVAGEIKARGGPVTVEPIVRDVIRGIGYDQSGEEFNAEGVRIQNLLGEQSANIDAGVSLSSEQGAGDQGMMFGYATAETPELMPLPILLAHRLSGGLSRLRKDGVLPWARPDAKTQVTVEYREGRPVQVTDVVVSTQHRPGVERAVIEEAIRSRLLPQHLAEWFHPGIRLQVNPTGVFEIGGPTGDCGVTGRKIIVDTYGGMARHGGGAFSGKDPSKVDRSAAYFARFVARQVIKARLARRVEIQVSYAIGVAQPVALGAETFGTGDDREVAEFVRGFDFRPAAISSRLDLLRPIYRQTTNYGHFGKRGLPWEE